MPLVVSHPSILDHIFQRPALLTSRETSWSSLYLEHRYHPADALPETASPQHGLILFTRTPQPINAERHLDGVYRREQVVAGDIVITPAGAPHRASWDAEGDFILLSFAPQVFTQALGDDDHADRLELQPQFTTADPLIHQIGLALQTVLQRGEPCSRLYADTMANALAVHLMQTYATRQPRLRTYQDGLPRHKLQQVTDYIQSHLDQDLGLAELAAIAQISPHYFATLFKQSTGLTPHQYVIRCRVEQARVLLLEGRLAIAEIAYQVGFANQSHLNRHFKRLLGITPKIVLQHRKNVQNSEDFTRQTEGLF